MCILNRQIVQTHQKTKNFIIKVIANLQLSLFCYALFYFSYIIHYFLRFEKFLIKAQRKKEKELKYQNIICLKLTDLELEVLNQAAAEAGLSRSEYLRQSFMNGPIHVHYEIVADMEILRKLVSEYGKIGFNLNQIARHFNSGGDRSRAVEEEIHQCISDLFLLRKKVLKMAGETNGNLKTY